MLADAHVTEEAFEVFEDCGQYGNGYGWDGVARQAIRQFMPELTEQFDFDSEAGTFVAQSTNEDALRRLGAILARTQIDLPLLTELIEAADPDWFD